MAVHPPDDRFPHAEPVRGKRIRVEAWPPVLDENLRCGVGDFQVDGHGAASVAGGVQHGLAGRLDERLVALGHDAVPHGDHIDRVPQCVFNLGGRGFDGFGKLAGFVAGVPVQPAPQFALLRAGQPDDVVLIAGAALDQREGLEHGVVEVGGDLGTLGGADTPRSLGFQVPPELQAPGQQHEGHPAEHGHGGQEGQPGLFPGPRAGHHHQHAGHHEGEPGGEARPAAGLVRLGLVDETRAAGLVQLHPGDRGAAQDRRDRDQGAQRHVNAEEPGDQDPGRQQQSGAQQDLFAERHARDLGSPGPLRRCPGASGGNEGANGARGAGDTGDTGASGVSGALTAGAIGDAGRRAFRLALSSSVGTMIQSQA